MTTLTPEALGHSARHARLQAERVRRGASRVEGLVRVLVLAAALASLAVGLNGALRDGANRVASTLAAATGTSTVR